MGNSQAAAFKAQFASLDLKEATKKQLWHVYHCTRKSSTANDEAEAVALSPPASPRGELPVSSQKTTAPQPVATPQSSTTPIVMIQLNVAHPTFRASLQPPKVLNPDNHIPSQYKLQYHMLESSFRALQWLQLHPHRNVLQVRHVDYISEEHLLYATTPYSAIEPIMVRLPMMCTTEILLGLCKVAEGLSHLHRTGVAHRNVTWRSVYLAYGAPSTFCKADDTTWILAEPQFLSSGAVKHEDSEALRDYLSEIRGLRQDAAALKYFPTEMNNPYAAEGIDWSKVPCGACDVYSFGVMLDMVLNHEKGRYSTTSMYFNPALDASLVTDGEKHVPGPKAAFDSLRAFSQRCMHDDPMKRPPIGEFLSVLAVRQCTFVRIMQQLDHMRGCSAAQRLRFYYLLHAEVLKVPYDVFLQRVIPKLLKPSVWSDDCSECFIRQLLIPIPSTSAPHVAPVHSSATADRSNTDMLVLPMDNAQRRALRLAPLADAGAEAVVHLPAAMVEHLVSDPFFAPPSESPTRRSTPSSSPTSRKPHEYHRYLPPSETENDNNNDQGTAEADDDHQAKHNADSNDCATNKPQHEHGAASPMAAMGATTGESRRLLLPQLPTCGILHLADYQSLIGPFLSAVTDECLQGSPSASSPQLLCVLLRNVESYLCAVSFSQIIIPKIIPFVVHCMKHISDDVVMESLYAFSTIHKFVSTAYDRLSASLRKETKSAEENSGDVPGTPDSPATVAQDKSTRKENAMIVQMEKCRAVLHNALDNEIFSLCSSDSVADIRLTALSIAAKSVTVSSKRRLMARERALAALCSNLTAAVRHRPSTIATAVILPASDSGGEKGTSPPSNPTNASSCSKIAPRSHSELKICLRALNFLEKVLDVVTPAEVVRDLVPAVTLLYHDVLELESTSGGEGSSEGDGQLGRCGSPSSSPITISTILSTIASTCLRLLEKFFSHLSSIEAHHNERSDGDDDSNDDDGDIGVAPPASFQSLAVSSDFRPRRAVIVDEDGWCNVRDPIAFEPFSMKQWEKAIVPRAKSEKANCSLGCYSPGMMYPAESLRGLPLYDFSDSDHDYNTAALLRADIVCAELIAAASSTRTFVCSTKPHSLALRLPSRHPANNDVSTATASSMEIMHGVKKGSDKKIAEKVDKKFAPPAAFEDKKKLRRKVQLADVELEEAAAAVATPVTAEPGGTEPQDAPPAPKAIEGSAEGLPRSEGIASPPRSAPLNNAADEDSTAGPKAPVTAPPVVDVLPSNSTTLSGSFGKASGAPPRRRKATSVIGQSPQHLQTAAVSEVFTPLCDDDL